MNRIPSFTAVALLSALVAAPLALADGSASTTTPTTPTTPAAPAKSSGYSSAHHSSNSKGKSSTAKVDLNSATKEQLMKLPGVNEAAAAKIIAARPFKAKDELLSKNLISKKEYDAIASHVTVKQEHMAGGTTK